jgi:LysM repeat protein
MRVRTRSACVVLAWGILLILVAVGSNGSFRPAQANIRIASNTTQITMTTNQDVAAAFATTAHPAAGRTARPPTFAVRPGDTLSGIAAALATPGGWRALYAANRQIIGPDPNVIHAGTVLVLPGQIAPARYTVTAGDTLSGIATALATPGGWPALYAANRQIIGPDPNAIHAGTVLTIPRPAPPAPAQASPAPTTGHHPSSAQRPAPAPAQRPAPRSAKPPASARPPASAKPSVTAGLLRCLQIVLLAAGLLIAAALLAKLFLAIVRRRRPGTRPAARPAAIPAAKDPRILLADYHQLVVTSSGPDGTVCVLRPPGADPMAILLAARLVLAQDRYEELAGALGMPAPPRPEG